MNSLSAMQEVWAAIAASPGCCRLLAVSVEVAVLAVAVWCLIRVLRIRSARVCSLLWILVLAKGLFGLAFGAPLEVAGLRLTEFARPSQSATAAMSAEDLARQEAEMQRALREAESTTGTSAATGVSVANATDDARLSSPAVGAQVPLRSTPSRLSGVFASISRFSLAAHAAGVLTAVWLAGVLWALLATALDLRRIRGLARASGAPSQELLAVFRAEAARLGIARVPALSVCTEVESPALAGFLRPTVLAPAWLAETADPDQLRWMLAHELMHFKQKDTVGLLVRRAAQVALWFHPAVWWAGRQWEEAMERACDRALIAGEADARHYAEQLHGVLKSLMARRSRVRVVTGLFATRTQIGKRIAALLTDSLAMPARLSPSSATLLVIGALAAFSFGVGIHHPAAAQEVGVVPTLKSLDEVVATLPHADVRGHVLDSQGRALGEVDVFLYYSHDTLGVRDGLAGKTRSAADGSFRFEKALVWEPDTATGIGVRHMQKYAVLARHAEQGINFTVLLRGDDPTSVGVRLPGKAANVPAKPTAVVQDTSGRPIPGVRVTLSYAKRFGADPQTDDRDRDWIGLRKDIGLYSVVTDETGGFAPIRMGDDKTNSFDMEKEGYAKAWMNGPVDGGEIPAGLLCPAATVSGRVTWPDGKPAAGAALILSYEGSDSDCYDATTADQEGRYAFRHAAGNGFANRAVELEREKDFRGTSAIRAVDQRPGSSFVFAVQAFSVSAGETLTKDLAFTEGCELSGTVTDIATGKPAAWVCLDREVEAPATPDRERGSNMLRDSATVACDAEGKFRTYVAAASTVNLMWARLEGGRYLIDEEWKRSDEGKRALFWRQVVTKSLTDLAFRVRLRPVAPLTGQVTGPQGQPEAGASVYFHPRVETVKTDREGRFTLATGPTDRDYDLVVLSAKKDLVGTVHLKAGTPTVALALAPTRTFRGEVKSADGLPAANLKFSMSLSVNGASIGGTRQELTTDAAGAFGAERLCPQATYAATWSGVTGSMYAGTQAAENGRLGFGSGTAQVDLAKVAEGEPIRFEAKMYVHTLVGRVVDENQVPVRGAQIEAGGALGPGSDLVRQEGGPLPSGFSTARNVSVGQDGRFTLEHLAAGEIPLRISASGYRAQTLRARTDAADFSVVLQPLGEAGVTLSVTVKDEKGQPVANAPLELRTQVDAAAIPTTASVTQVTDAAGKAQLVFVDPTPWNRAEGYILCDKPGYNLAYRSANGLDEDVDLEIVLEKEGKGWQSRLVDTQGKPLAGAKVQVSGVGYTDRRTGGISVSGFWSQAERATFTTDADGRFELKRFGSNLAVSCHIEASGYGDAEHAFFYPAPVSDPEKEIVVQPSGTITGKIVAEGGGDGAGMWTVHARAADGSDRQSGIVRADGSAFRIQGLQAGAYTVLANAANREAQSRVGPKAASVSVVLGQTATVDMRVEPGTLVQGRIAQPQDAADGGAGGGKRIQFVLAQSADNQGYRPGIHFAQVDRDGRWTLFLPEGTLQLGYAVNFSQPIFNGQEITVTKGKPQEEIAIAVK